MKTFLIFLLIAAVGFAAVKLSIKSPDQSIPSATENAGTVGTDGTPATGDTEQIAPNRITAEFDGYGPGGKEEHGSVQASQSTLVRTGNTFDGSVTFDMSTITSVPVKDKLIEHLKSDDFFDVANYPTATFAVTESSDTQVRGILTMRGVSQELTLPVSHDEASGTYSSTVRVNMELFGINQTFTDKEFVLRVTVR